MTGYLGHMVVTSSERGRKPTAFQHNAMEPGVQGPTAGWGSHIHSSVKARERKPIPSSVASWHGGETGFCDHTAWTGILRSVNH